MLIKSTIHYYFIHTFSLLIKKTTLQVQNLTGKKLIESSQIGMRGHSTASQVIQHLSHTTKA